MIFWGSCGIFICLYVFNDYHEEKKEDLEKFIQDTYTYTVYMSVMSDAFTIRE